MPETDLDTLAFDYATAKTVASHLANRGITAVAEEYEIGMAHIRLDPEDADPTGYVAVAALPEPGNEDGGWVMIRTEYHDELHTYETIEDGSFDALGVPVDEDPETIAEAIANFLD